MAVLIIDKRTTSFVQKRQIQPIFDQKGRLHVQRLRDTPNDMLRS